VARVLIAEPTPEIRALLERAVVRLGHEVLPLSRDGRAEPPDADVLVLEPEVTGGLELAHALRARRPDAAIVVCGIRPPSREVLALAPAALLEKPFTRDALDRAIALAARTSGATGAESDDGATRRAEG